MESRSIIVHFCISSEKYIGLYNCLDNCHKIAASGYIDVMLQHIALFHMHTLQISVFITIIIIFFKMKIGLFSLLMLFFFHVLCLLFRSLRGTVLSLNVYCGNIITPIFVALLKCLTYYGKSGNKMIIHAYKTQ